MPTVNSTLGLRTTLEATGNAYIINETYAVETTQAGSLISSATWISTGGGYIQLTTATNGQFGNVDYTNTLPSSFIAQWDFRTSTSGADASYFYFGNSSAPNQEDASGGGWIFAFDEYSGENVPFAARFNGTQIAAYQLPIAMFADNNWHTAKVTFNAGYMQVYIDGFFLFAIDDRSNYPRSLGGNHVGLGARTGGVNAEHDVRNFSISAPNKTLALFTDFGTSTNAPSVGDIQTSHALSGSSLTFSKQIKDGDNGLLVLAGASPPGDPVSQSLPSSVTYNGVNLTYVEDYFVQDDDVRLTAWWMSNPPRGTANVVVTWGSSNTHGIMSAALSLRGIKALAKPDVTTGVNALSGATVTNTLKAINPNSLVIDFIGASSSSDSLTNAGSQTQQANIQDSGGSAFAVSSQVVTTQYNTASFAWTKSNSGRGYVWMALSFPADPLANTRKSTLALTTNLVVPLLKYDHVILILMENSDYSEVIGDTTDCPYINNTLLPIATSLTNIHAVDHPSEPNYLALISGSEQGQSGSDANVGPPDNLALKTTTNIVDELITAGISYRFYSEGMPSDWYTRTSRTMGDTGSYTEHHEPFVYFQNNNSSNTNSRLTNLVPYSQFATDLAVSGGTGLAKFTFINPQNNHNMHDSNGSANRLKAGDNWLSTELAAILTSDAYTKQNTIIFLVWDEADTSGTNQIPTLVIGPGVKKNNTSATNYNHYNTLATMEQILNIPGMTSNDQTAAPFSLDVFMTTRWSTVALKTTLEVPIKKSTLALKTTLETAAKNSTLALNATLQQSFLAKSTLALSTTLNQNHIGFFREDWNSGTIPAKWNNWGNPQTSVVSNQLNITTTTGAAYFGVDSFGSSITYDLTSSEVRNQLVNAGNQAIVSYYVYPIYIYKDASNQLSFNINQNTLYATQIVGGVTTNLFSAAYSTVNHQYFRIRESLGTIYWETSPDGFHWNAFTLTANPFAITAIRAGQEVGTNSTEASTTTAIFDNFNLLQGSKTLALFTLLETAGNKSTLALSTTLAKQKNLALLTILSKPGVSTLALRSTLVPRVSTLALLTTLEEKPVKVLALKTTLEKAPQKSTLALKTTLETTGIKSTVALFTDLKATINATIALKTTLESAKKFSTIALKTNIEANKGGTIALKTTLEKTVAIGFRVNLIPNPSFEIGGGWNVTTL